MHSTVTAKAAKISELTQVRFKNIAQALANNLKDIAFTDVFLAVEVDRPSTASGVHLITENDDGLTWLVERKRPSTVIKFSGTLVHHSHRRDLRSATISAFAHFVFGYSKRTLVVADLQGNFYTVCFHIANPSFQGRLASSETMMVSSCSI